MLFEQQRDSELAQRYENLAEPHNGALFSHRRVGGYWRPRRLARSQGAITNQKVELRHYTANV